MTHIEGRKEYRTSAWAGCVPPFLQQKVKGFKRHGSREGRMLRSQHEGGRAHLFDPRHGPLLREIVQPLVVCATTRSHHVLR
jgi:hypothetical protein